MVAPVVEAVDDAALNEKRLTRVKINLLAGHRERGDTVKSEGGFVEVVVAVWRRHASLCRREALEDRDTPISLIRIDVEDHTESAHLNPSTRCT